MEKSLSTFAQEMATSAMILGKLAYHLASSSASEIGLATPNTLVLVDELGRGTSTIEGIGIAHAIAEELIRIKVCFLSIPPIAFYARKCFVFFATYGCIL